MWQGSCPAKNLSGRALTKQEGVNSLKVGLGGGGGGGGVGGVGWEGVWFGGLVLVVCGWFVGGGGVCWLVFFPPSPPPPWTDAQRGKVKSVEEKKEKKRKGHLPTFGASKKIIGQGRNAERNINGLTSMQRGGTTRENWEKKGKGLETPGGKCGNE